MISSGNFSGIGKLIGFYDKDLNGMVTSVYESTVNKDRAFMVRALAPISSIPSILPLHIEALVLQTLGAGSKVLGDFRYRGPFTAPYMSDGEMDIGSLSNPRGTARLDSGRATTTDVFMSVTDKYPGIVYEVPRAHISLDHLMEKASPDDYGFIYDSLNVLFATVIGENIRTGYCHNNMHSGNVILDIRSGRFVLIDHSHAYLRHVSSTTQKNVFEALGQSKIYRELCFGTDGVDVWDKLCRRCPFMKGFVRDVPEDNTGLASMIFRWFYTTTDKDENVDKDDEKLVLDEWAAWADLAGLIFYLMVKNKDFYAYISKRLDVRSTQRVNKFVTIPPATPIKLSFDNDGLVKVEIIKSSYEKVLESPQKDYIADAIAVAAALIDTFQTYLGKMSSSLSKHLILNLFDNRRLSGMGDPKVLKVLAGLTTRYPLLTFLFYDSGVINPFMYHKCMRQQGLQDILDRMMRQRVVASALLPISSIVTPSTFNINGDEWMDTLVYKHDLDTITLGHGANDEFTKAMGIDKLKDWTLNVPWSKCIDHAMEQVRVLSELGVAKGPQVQVTVTTPPSNNLIVQGGGKHKKKYIIIGGKRRLVRLEGRRRYVVTGGERVWLADVRGLYKYCD